MPGTRPTQGDDGAIPGPFAAIAQEINSIAGQAQANATATALTILDQFQNAALIIGSLNQTVTIGAGWISGVPNGGVQVTTGLTSFGLCYPTAFAHTTITLTQGSTSATVASSAGFTSGMQVGAASSAPPAYPPVSPTPYLTPGTTATFSGTAVTLSAPALASGTGLYFCGVTFTTPSVPVHP